MYWDSTSDWRLSYYNELHNRKKKDLSMIELAERELDELEYYIITQVLIDNAVRKVCDLGCGVGRQILYYASNYKNIEFWGIDISRVQIETLKNVIQKNNVKNIVALQMDAASIKDINQRFDLITLLNNSFGCMGKVQQMRCLESLESVISTNGILVISCFNRLDLAMEAYQEWGFPAAKIDYDNGVVNTGEYISCWKTESLFLPYLIGSNKWSICEKKTVGLGTVYVFRRRGRNTYEKF